MMNRTVVMLVLLFGCGKKGATSGGVVGAVCARDSDCQSGLFCEVRIPGGACTKTCTPCPAACDSDCVSGCDAGSGVSCEKGCVPANRPLCPDNAACVQVQFAQASAAEVRCLAECDLSSPCRTDTLFTCTSIGNATSVCVPGKTR